MSTISYGLMAHRMSGVVSASSTQLTPIFQASTVNRGCAFLFPYHESLEEICNEGTDWL